MLVAVLMHFGCVLISVNLVHSLSKVEIGLPNFRNSGEVKIRTGAQANDKHTGYQGPFNKRFFGGPRKKVIGKQPVDGVDGYHDAEEYQ